MQVDPAASLLAFLRVSTSDLAGSTRALSESDAMTVLIASTRKDCFHHRGDAKGDKKLRESSSDPADPKGDDFPPADVWRNCQSRVGGAIRIGAS
jgi:hypothetical protein